MYIYRDRLFFAVLLTMIFAAVLSVAIGVGGCWWPISARAVLMELSFWQFSNNPTSSSSVDDAITFIMILHSTCTGPFLGVISWIGILDFVPSKHILRLWFVPPVLICRMHRSICGESFRFLCILLLCLDVLRCHLETEFFFAVSIVRFVCTTARNFRAINIVGSIPLA